MPLIRWRWNQYIVRSKSKFQADRSIPLKEIELNSQRVRSNPSGERLQVPSPSLHGSARKRGSARSIPLYLGPYRDKWVFFQRSHF